MTERTTVVMDNLTFAEGPRWRDGRLYFSDFYDHRVWAVTPDGQAEKIVSVPGQPSGLGWRPDGAMLVVSMTDRKLMRLEQGRLIEEADCGAFAGYHCNDMVVDANGNAYIGNFGFDTESDEDPRPTNLILVRPGEPACVAADELLFPNGTVITPDGKTLIVGETWAGRMTAFDIAPDGSLSNRRTWAMLLELEEGYFPVPDGCCMDETGALWIAAPSTNDVIRVAEGGKLLDKITVSNHAYACMLGGDDGKTLFICTAGSSSADECRQNRDGKIESVRVQHKGVGLP